MNFKLNHLFVCILALAFLASFSSAYAPGRPETCSANGRWNGYNCEFIVNPTAILGCHDSTYNCEYSMSGVSKYKSACVGYDYYDYTASFGQISNAWLNPQTGKCEYIVTQNCDAHVDYNSNKCGYKPPEPEYNPPSYNPPAYEPPAYEPPSYNPPAYYSPSYYSTCGNYRCDLSDYYYGCSWECSSYGYGYPNCELDAVFSNVYENNRVDIRVKYRNLRYSAGVARVYCGNGQVKTAWTCSGTTGSCYVSCYYDEPGYYRVSGYIDGTTCSSDYIRVKEKTGQPPSTPTPPQPPSTPTPPQPPAPSKDCSVLANPQYIQESGSTNVVVSYSGFQEKPNTAKLICGEGVPANLVCTGTAAQGACTGECNYGTQSTYPRIFTIDALIDGFVCDSTKVQLSAPKAQPAQPGSLVVSVKDYYSGAGVDGALVFVYSGSQTVKSGSTSDGIVSFSGMQAGDYLVKASKQGYSQETASVAVQEAQQASVELKLKKKLFASCSVNTNPQTVRGGSSTIVTIDYNGAAEVPRSVPVDCGNGQYATAACQGSNEQGVCAAQCNYQTYNSYPQYFTVQSEVNGLKCSTAKVTVVAQELKTGFVKATVTDCDTGKAIPGAVLNAYGLLYYTNAFGVAEAQGIPAGTWTLTVNADGYDSSGSTVSVYAGKTSMLPVCLNKKAVLQEQKAFDLQLVSAPNCPYDSNPGVYQIKVKNNLAVNIDAAISYSSNAVTGPSHVSVPANGYAIVDVTPNVDSGVAGGSVVLVTFSTLSVSASTASGNYDYSAQIQLKVCEGGGLTLQVIEDEIQAFAGEDSCFNLIVRNKGYGTATAYLSAESDESFDYDFYPSDSFVINKQEIKNVKVCVGDTSGADSGAHTIHFDLTSSLGDASAVAVLDLSGPSDFGIDDNCYNVNAETTVSPVRVELSNNGLGGDFQISISDNELDARPQQDELLNFQNGETRYVTVYVDAYGKTGGNYYADLYLKKDGKTVLQEELCFYVRGVSNIRTKLSGPITAQPNQGSSSVLTVTNAGSLSDWITIESDDAALSITPFYFNLKPGESQSIDLHYTPGSTVFSKTIPVKIYSGYRQSTTSYSGSGYSYYSVSVDCDNGDKKSVNCDTADEECGVVCEYDDVGTYYPDADIGGTSCSYGYVRVVDNLDDECFLTPSKPFIEEDGSTKISVECDFDSNDDDTFFVYCDNHDNDYYEVKDCRTKDCQVTCDYEDAGVREPYVVGTNVNIWKTKVVVGDPNHRECRIVADPLVIEENDETDVILHYYDVPDNYQGSSTSYTSTSGGRLVATENLLVSVIASTSQSSTLPLVNSNLQIAVPQSVQLAADSGQFIAIAIKNNNYYAVSSLLVYLTDLPPGVSFNQPNPIDLAPGEEKTVSISIHNTNAAPGAYYVEVHAQGPGVIAPSKTLQLVVMTPSDVYLNAGVSEPLITYGTETDAREMILDFVVTNNEDALVSLTPSMKLPEGWAFALDKQSIVLGAGESTSLKVTVLPSDSFDANAGYDTTLVLNAQNGKSREVPVYIPSKNANPLTGLFTAAASDAVLIAFIVAALLAGAYLIYLSRSNGG
ncbi:MAG: carboxypeptidase regulatory-like domain-containing protein [Candidatus Micrarchaeota archaeon]